MNWSVSNKVTTKKLMSWIKTLDENAYYETSWTIREEMGCVRRVAPLSPVSFARAQTKSFCLPPSSVRSLFTFSGPIHIWRAQWKAALARARGFDCIQACRIFLICSSSLSWQMKFILPAGRPVAAWRTLSIVLRGFCLRRLAIVLAGLCFWCVLSWPPSAFGCLQVTSTRSHPSTLPTRHSWSSKSRASTSGTLFHTSALPRTRSERLMESSNSKVNHFFHSSNLNISKKILKVFNIYFPAEFPAPSTATTPNAEQPVTSKTGEPKWRIK